MNNQIRTLVLSLVVLASPRIVFAAAGFDADFAPKTMRLDYFHSGTASEEHVAVDRIISDGPWAGSRTRLLDELNLGKYFFYVFDAETNRPLYSRGFASIYGEWETTPEAKKKFQTFHESLRFPWPKRPVTVRLEKRDALGVFHEVWSMVVDPASRAVNPTDLAPIGKVWSVIDNGAPSEKVDLLILGDGYTAAELPKFHADAKRLVDVLFRVEPYKSRRADFNVRAIDLPTPAAGVNRPHLGEFRRTPLSIGYSAFDSERYVLGFDNRMIRDVASAAPYEFLEILVNEKTYGGGGIFAFQATASVDTGFGEYVFVHEFGHHFAGLGDEYYTSDVAYETGAAEHPEPWEPNITAMHDPAKLKWKDLLDKDVPIPTPWDREPFEKNSKVVQAKRRKIRADKLPETVMDKLFREEQAYETPLLAGMKYSKKVGAFEGAGYEAKGLYRSETDCIMFSRDEVGFCRVCRRAISRMIDLYSMR